MSHKEVGFMRTFIEVLQYVIAPVFGILLLITIFAKLNYLFFPINPAVVILLDFITILAFLMTGYSIFDKITGHS